MKRKRVGLVAFMHESNSFNPNLTTYEMFVERNLLFGEAIIREWSESQHEIGGMLEQVEASGAEIVPLVSAWAMPAGPVEEEAYERILAEILKRIMSEPLDGLLLCLHGAMVAQHIRDADGATVQRIRQAAGPALPIVMTLDLHANISSQMISGVTATTVYRTYPHIDQRERGREAARMLDGILEGRTRPVQALEKPPLLITLLAQQSGSNPMTSLYGQMEELLRLPGIISASMALGFPYADVEEMGPSILIVADGDDKLASETAKTLAQSAWSLRDQCHFAGVPLTEAVSEAAKAEATPITLLDVGDNVGGGSPGDGTAIFEALQRADVHNILVVLHDPEAVQGCSAAGVGQTISMEVGGKSDILHDRPVRVQGRVRLLHDGAFAEFKPRHGGRFWNNQGLTAVVESPEGDTIVLTSLRMAPFSLEQILSLGIKPELKRVLIAKGAVAPRAAYEPVSAQIIEVDTAGITAANPANFDYLYRRKPMFPFERDAVYTPVAKP